MGPDQAVGGHEAGHPLAAAALVEATQLGVDPRCAIGPPERRWISAISLGQLGVAQAAR